MRRRGRFHAQRQPLHAKGQNNPSVSPLRGSTAPLPGEPNNASLLFASPGRGGGSRQRTGGVQPDERPHASRSFGRIAAAGRSAEGEGSPGDFRSSARRHGLRTPTGGRRRQHRQRTAGACGPEDDAAVRAPGTGGEGPRGGGAGCNVNGPNSLSRDR